MIRYCEECGNATGEDESFCSKCGKPIAEAAAIDKLRDAKSAPERERSKISLLVPTKRLVLIGLILAALFFIPKAIYEVNSPDYKDTVANRDECIMNQQDLSPTSTSYQRLYEIYEEIISSYDKDIKECQTKAWVNGIIGLLSIGLAFTLIVQDRKKKQRSKENDAGDESVQTARPAYCRHCGNPVQEGMAYCSCCGKQISNTQTAGKRKTRRYVVMVCAAVVLLAVCTILAVRYTDNKNIFENAYEKAGGDEVCKKWVTVMRDGSGIKIDTNPRNIEEFYDDDALKAVRRINNALGMPDSVIEKMLSTRALDGRQSQTYNGITVSWTYHPDAGLEIVYERT